MDFDKYRILKNTEKRLTEYEKYVKYVKYCESLGKKPRTWYEWEYCTYSGFEESWRLNH